MMSLIPDLQNLCNEYLDPISYLNVVAENPKAFNKPTYQKILKNYESQFPLQFFTEAWNMTQEMMKLWDKYKFKVDPRYVCSLVIKYGVTTSAEIGGVRDYINEIFDEIDKTIEEQNTRFESDYEEILANMEDQKSADEIGLLDHETQRSLLFEARKILTQTDPEVYDTTDTLGDTFANKITPVLRDLLEKRKV